MDDNTNNNIPNQHYEPSPMMTDSNDLNNILGQMPTPVSNDLRASTSNSFMSPLEVDQQGYDRMNGVPYQSHGNDEVFIPFRMLYLSIGVLYSLVITCCHSDGHHALA